MEEDTRRRITEAAVELHGTVGPASTTVTELAKLAGVSRMTVYNHFPTEADLFQACSSHWAAEHPFPDPSSWTAVTDPPARLRAALREIYAWYRAGRSMLEKVLRDIQAMPSLHDLMDDFWGSWMHDVMGALGEGWSSAEGSPEAVQAMLSLVVDFNTWRILTRSGLDDDRAAELAARMVTEATA